MVWDADISSFAATMASAKASGWQVSDAALPGADWQMMAVTRTGVGLTSRGAPIPCSTMRREAPYHQRPCKSNRRFC